MLFILFLPHVFGKFRGARPNQIETTITPTEYWDVFMSQKTNKNEWELDITELLLNITQYIEKNTCDSQIFYNILNNNCKIHEDQMFQVLSTIVSPVKEIRHTLDRSVDCSKILEQYGIIFICLTIITGTLNLTGMLSVILAWKKCARYKFPASSIPESASPDESVSLICQSETTV